MESEVLKLARETYNSFIALCAQMTIAERVAIADHVDAADARLGRIHDAPAGRG